MLSIDGVNNMRSIMSEVEIKIIWLWLMSCNPWICQWEIFIVCNPLWGCIV